MKKWFLDFCFDVKLKEHFYKWSPTETTPTNEIISRNLSDNREIIPLLQEFSRNVSQLRKKTE